MNRELAAFNPHWNCYLGIVFGGLGQYLLQTNACT